MNRRTLPVQQQKVPFPLGSFAVLLWLGCGSAPAPSTTTLDRVAGAMGGAEAILSITSEEVEAVGARHSPEQGYSADLPRHLSNFRYVRTDELDQARIRLSHHHVTSYLTPDQYDFTEVVDGESGVVDGRDTVFSPPQVKGMYTSRATAELSHTRLTSPLRVIKRALADPSLAAEAADVESSEVTYQVLVIREEGQPELQLLIDPATFLPAAARVVEDHPPLGDVLVEARFSDYRTTGGVKVPFRVNISLDGVEAHDEDRVRVALNVPTSAATYDVPAEFQPPVMPVVPTLAALGKRSTQFLIGLKYLTQTFFYYDQAGLPAATFQELAPGVQQVRGISHHMLLVEQKDHLVLMDAPLPFAERSLETLQAIKARYPDKPIRTIIASHFHSDHIGGIRHFAAEGGVTVLAGAPSVPYYERLFSRPHTVAPDRFAANPVPVQVEGVEGVKVLDDGQRRIDVYHIESIHSNDTLIAYLPAEKILFVSDLFNPGLFSADRPAPYLWGFNAGQLYDELQRLGLDVQLIATAHGSRTGTMDELRVVGGR